MHDQPLVVPPSLNIDASYPFAKCQSVIEVKIFIVVSSEKLSIDMTLRWRVNLSVMSFLPPPGGPIALFLNKRFALLILKAKQLTRSCDVTTHAMKSTSVRLILLESFLSYMKP